MLLVVRFSVFRIPIPFGVLGLSNDGVPLGSSLTLIVGLFTTTIISGLSVLHLYCAPFRSTAVLTAPCLSVRSNTSTAPTSHQLLTVTDTLSASAVGTRNTGTGTVAEGERSDAETTIVPERLNVSVFLAADEDEDGKKKRKRGSLLTSLVAIA